MIECNVTEDIIFLKMSKLQSSIRITVTNNLLHKLLEINREQDIHKMISDRNENVNIQNKF